MSLVYTQKEYHFIEERIGAKLCRLFAKLDAFLAGGSITSIFSNQPINDFDIFFRDKESFEKAKRYFSVLIKYDDASTKELCVTERATTYSRTSKRGEIAKIKQEKYGPTYDVKWKDEKIAIQLVDPRFVVGTPEEVFMGFDFTICMGAYLFKKGEFVFDKTFFKDIARRELVFNVNANNVVSSIFRAQKYKARGFTMTMAEEMKMALVFGTKKFKTFGDFVHAAGSVMNEEVAQHLYNHIRYPSESNKEKDSLLEQPYNPEAIIEWLEELQHANMYVPSVAVEGGAVFPKCTGFSGVMVKDILESDLSDESVREIEERYKKEDDNVPFLIKNQPTAFFPCNVVKGYNNKPISDDDFDLA